MPRWVPINGREVWDVPRIFFADLNGQLILFDCQFDETIEDYPEEYQVFLMPTLSQEELDSSWRDLHQRAIRKLGDIPLLSVTFDPTKRKQIDAAILDELLAPAARASG